MLPQVIVFPHEHEIREKIFDMVGGCPLRHLIEWGKERVYGTALKWEGAHCVGCVWIRRQSTNR